MSRHYLWVVRGILIPFGAFLVADIINQVLGNHLEVSARPLVQEGSPSSPQRNNRPDVRQIIEGNIFNVQMRDEAVEVQAPEVEEVSDAPADLKLSLTGTVLGDDQNPGDSFAIIQHQRKREQRLYRLGDWVDTEVKLLGIEAEEVRLLVDAQRQVRLKLYEEKTQKGKASVPGASSETKDRIQNVAANRWVLDRQEIDGALENLSQLLTKARVVPHFKGGKANGFRVFSIVPGSFFSKIGLQNGDILQQINGVEIRSPEKFMTVFQQLRGEASVSLDLVRNNRKQTFQYEIR